MPGTARSSVKTTAQLRAMSDDELRSFYRSADSGALVASNPRIHLANKKAASAEMARRLSI